MTVLFLEKEHIRFVNESIKKSEIKDIDKKVKNAINKLLKSLGYCYLDVDYYSTTSDLSGAFTKINVSLKPKDLKTVITEIVAKAKKDALPLKRYRDKRAAQLKKHYSKIDKNFEKKRKKFIEKAKKEFLESKKRLINSFKKTGSLKNASNLKDLRDLEKMNERSIKREEEFLRKSAENEKLFKKIELGKKFLEEKDKEFLKDSAFPGVCTSLAIQKILENRMDTNSHIRCLQRKLNLFTLQIAKKDKVNALKDIRFKDDSSQKIIKKFKKFLNKKFKLDIASVNGYEDKKVFNETIDRNVIRKERFTEDHNLIVLSEENSLLKDTHVIYFN
jgi:hypothetical protein